MRQIWILAVFVACVAGVAWGALAILSLLGFHYAIVPSWVPLP